jgi:5-methylcytosine-specific restriction endonuclease McrA
MDWQPTQVNALRTKEREYWGSPEEIAQRRKEGLCLRCGRKGHLVRGCLGPISHKPMKMAGTKQVTAISEVDNSYLSDSSVESQGKE